MRKKLSILRHGEAEPGFGYKRDSERKLSEQGISKMKILGGILKEKGIEFDLLVKSPALRAMETARLITGFVEVKEKLVEERLYEGSVETLLDILWHMPPHLTHVLLVGHNPGLSALLVYLTNDFNLSLFPGTMAMLTLDLSDWEMLSQGSCTLVEVIQ